MMDKNIRQAVSLHLVNDHLLFEGIVEGNRPISIDYIPPLGDNMGYTSLELLLMSLASCVSTALLVLLRKQGKNIEHFSITSEGVRRKAHPTSFEVINLYFEIKSADVTSEILDKTLSMVENICPVWYMIKDNTKIVFHHNISN